ncbi:MAG: glycogen/starch/alpha-glucan family phosphorylase [Clostridia bacterium]|nr:glycogen/starch/alpha-glucan family phosphorylase [Clostridia bacterium]
MNKEKLLRDIDEIVQSQKGKDSDGIVSLYNEISKKCMEYINFTGIGNETKTAHYLSMEFLMGRMIDSNLMAMGILEDTRRILEKHGWDRRCFEDIDDYALGNGGLGRLAACFLDSGATIGINLHGYGIRYKYGLFKQVFSEDGAQKEKEDDWQVFGDPWSVRREDEKEEIVFADASVMAVPYDMPVIGFGNKKINMLRLWQSEPSAGGTDLGISDFLYPDDSTDQGKTLRLRQQYFFAAASIRSIMKKYMKEHGDDVSCFSEFNQIQLNDTHPVIAITEMILVLMKEYGKTFDFAARTAGRCFNYTNHTVMPEALEKWDTVLLGGILPEHLAIARKLDRRLCRELSRAGEKRKARVNYRIMERDRLHMARLAVYVCGHVNGVSEIHTGILRDSLFRDWLKIYPGKLLNITNGITQRRWLDLCNPELFGLIASRIGEGFVRDLSLLKNIRPMIDEGFIDDFIKVKQARKRELAEYIAKKQGIVIDPSTVFDIHIKRIHEYKRQLLNIFSILYLYFEMKDGGLKDFRPTTFIFGGKAAAGYKRAKAIIKYINMAAGLINNDPVSNGRLRIVFVENYNVSYAEKLFPAADASVQISTAGTEASGTGNMKFMLNGAVTLGTMDGANIEIVERAGRENNYIFGADTDEINRIRESYDPLPLLLADKKLGRVVGTLSDGTFEDDDGSLGELYGALTEGASWHRPDHYFVLHDFRAFIECRLRLNMDTADERPFARKCINNSISAGEFSSDRAVRQYADKIWGITVNE